MPQLSTFKPAYLWRRVVQHRFQSRYPQTPWLTESAIRLLDGWLNPADRGFEWGSGRSTCWFASRCAHVTSVDHHKQWYDTVTKQLKDAGLSDKVDYRWIECELTGADEPESHAYAAVIDEHPDETFDWILVDALMRETCMRHAIPKLKSGGLLILDNANRFVPNRFEDSFATVCQSREKPPTPAWEKLLAELASWRSMPTTDGIWDTHFWIKP